MEKSLQKQSLGGGERFDFRWNQMDQRKSLKAVALFITHKF